MISTALFTAGYAAIATNTMYSGALSLLRCRYSRDLDGDEVNVVVTGGPSDLAASNRSGARFGPAGIRAASSNLVGMDLAEMAPPFDHAEITSLAAASLAFEFLCVVDSKRVAE